MNIFILDKDLEKNAQYYCDQHIVKMILESAQLLCSVVLLKDGNAPYKLTHKDHPCTKWLLENETHWDFLISLVTALNNEYKKRFNHNENHKSFDIILSLTKPKYSYKAPIKKFISVTDTVEKLSLNKTILSYRKYYLKKSKEFSMRWSNSKKPYWLKKMELL